MTIRWDPFNEVEKLGVEGTDTFFLYYLHFTHHLMDHGREIRPKKTTDC